jgi:hypothetical protein
MIFPLISGYIIGRWVSKKAYAIILGVLIGSVLGLISTYVLIPLLYPMYTGDVGLIVVPEFDSIGIMFLTPDFVIYTEIVYMLTRSYIIDLVFLVTGAFFTTLGTLFGSAHRIERNEVLFEVM